MPRSPSVESLNLTVLPGDGTAGAVGAGRPEVGPYCNYAREYNFCPG